MFLLICISSALSGNNDPAHSGALLLFEAHMRKVIVSFAPMIFVF